MEPLQDTDALNQSSRRENSTRNRTSMVQYARRRVSYLLKAAVMLAGEPRVTPPHVVAELQSKAAAKRERKARKRLERDEEEWRLTPAKGTLAWQVLVIDRQFPWQTVAIGEADQRAEAAQ